MKYTGSTNESFSGPPQPPDTQARSAHRLWRGCIPSRTLRSGCKALPRFLAPVTLLKIEKGSYMVRRWGQNHAFNLWERAPTGRRGCGAFRDTMWGAWLASPGWHEAFPLGLACLVIPTSSLFGFAYILSFYRRFAQISYEKCLNVPSQIPILPFTS